MLKIISKIQSGHSVIVGSSFGQTRPSVLKPDILILIVKFCQGKIFLVSGLLYIVALSVYIGNFFFLKLRGRQVYIMFKMSIFNKQTHVSMEPSECKKHSYF